VGRFIVRAERRLVIVPVELGDLVSLVAWSNIIVLLEIKVADMLVSTSIPIDTPSLMIAVDLSAG
jgi:hypothetical protein